MATLSLSELLGTPVIDSTGRVRGRVREIGVNPHEPRVNCFVVRTRQGDRALSADLVETLDRRALRATKPADEWPKFLGTEGMLLLERDLLDQQIIDVHGRKVVRVNDVDFQEEHANSHVTLKISEVDVGVRRLRCAG